MSTTCTCFLGNLYSYSYSFIYLIDEILDRYGLGQQKITNSNVTFQIHNKHTIQFSKEEEEEEAESAE